MRFWNVIDTGIPGDALGAPTRGRCRDDGGPFELGVYTGDQAACQIPATSTKPSRRSHPLKSEALAFGNLTALTNLTWQGTGQGGRERQERWKGTWGSKGTGSRMHWQSVNSHARVSTLCDQTWSCPRCRSTTGTLPHCTSRFSRSLWSAATVRRALSDQRCD